MTGAQWQRVVSVLAGIGAAWAVLCLITGYWGGEIYAEHRPVAASRPGLAVVFLSGDMGTGLGVEPGVFSRFSQQGYPLVAVNTLAFLRQPRQPGEIAALVVGAIDRARALAHGGRVLLIGQSLGADMLHVGLAGLPEARRGEVAGVVYVVPGSEVLYRATPGDLFTWFARPDAPALATASRVDWAPVSCISGEQEDDSLCPLLRLPRLHRAVLPGGHLLRLAVGRLNQALAEAIAFSLAGGAR